MNQVLENIPPLRMIRPNRMIRFNRTIRFKLSLQLLAVLGLVFALIACGGGDDDNKMKGTATLVTSATPVGETYNSAQSITLTCTDTSSGCGTTYYNITNVSNTPPSTSITYNGAISIDAEGSTELWFFSIDNDGKREVWRKQTYIIDTILPATAATPVGNTYNSTQEVTLNCLDDGGSGCGATYYTTDGSDPTIESTQYTEALFIDISTALKFFSVDNANNSDTVQTQIYSITSPLASGEYNSAFLMGGEVWTWGLNDVGQLGDGNATIDSPTPVQVVGQGGVGFLTNVAAIAGSSHYTLALKGDNTVWAWGRNNVGQLGAGSKGNGAYLDIPIQANGLPTIIAIATGRWHSLAIDDNRTVWTWGGNSEGQLGQGTATGGGIIAPAQVCDSGETTVPCPNVLSNVVAVAGGYWYSLALKDDGTVWTWGGRLDGMYTPGNRPIVNNKTPVQVSGLTEVIAISGGRDHALALKRDGTLWAWGENTYGQLGNGKPSKNSFAPVQVVDPADSTGFLTNVIAIGAGRGHSLALKRDDIWAWGRNFDGELGDGKSASGKPTEDFGATAPRGISYAPDGTLWVTDTDSDMIYHINTSGTFIASFSTVAVGSGFEDGNTRSIAYAPGDTDTLWVTGHATDTVYNISLGGTVLSSFLITEYDDTGTMVQGITYDTSDGTLWVVNHETNNPLANKIYNINTDGTLNSLNSSFLVSKFAPGVSNVSDISYDSITDTLWVIHPGTTSKIYNIEKDGTLISEFPIFGDWWAYDPLATNTQGISYAPNGTLWVVDMKTDKFYNLPIATGLPVQVVGEAGSGLLSNVIAIGGGMGHSAHSLALDSYGVLWAWGRDGDGELGNDDALSSSPTPVKVAFP